MKDIIFSSFAEQRGHAGTQATNGHLSQLRIAVIGQSNFAADVLDLLVEGGYKVVGVFTIPDKGNREDILATTAKRHNIPVFKFALWRRKVQINHTNSNNPFKRKLSIIFSKIHFLLLFFRKTKFGM